MSSSNDLELRDFEWAVRLNRVTLKLLGLWPETERDSYEKLKCHLRTLIVSLIIFFGMTFPYVHSLAKMHDDIMLIIEHLRFIVPSITCFLRVLIIWWKKEAVMLIMEMICEDWSKSKDQQERNTMIIWAQKARFVTTCVYCLTVVSVASFVLLPAFGISITHLTHIPGSEDKNMLPLEAYQMYGLTEWPQYGVTYICHVIIVTFTAIAYTGVDIFLGLLVFHICGQLDILSTRLACLNKLVRFHDGLRNCVITHIRLLRAVAVIEDTYNLILLAVFLNFGVLFASYGFWFMSIYEEKNEAFVIRLIYVVSVIAHAFVHMALYCAVGEILVTQCDRVYYALINLEWYYLDPKMAKQLLLLILRTKEPCYITAGKIFPMTMVTLCSLIKTTASYISVMLASSV